MKILHVFKTYLPVTYGGVEQVIFNLAEEAAAAGHTVDVITTAPPQDMQKSSSSLVVGRHRVYQTRRDFEMFSVSFSVQFLFELRRIAKGYDLIHYHFPWPWMDIGTIFATREVPYIVTYHSDIVKQKFLLHAYAPLMYRFLKGAANVVATSDNYVASSPVLKKLGSGVKVVPLGIPDPREDVRLEGGVRPEIQTYVNSVQPYFLFVGVLRYYKGLEFLIRAAAQVKSRILLAGAGPERSRLEKLQQELGADNVVFVGRVSEAEKALLLKHCYGFVFPSHLRSEAYGVSLLEAAAYGRPMICCDIKTGTNFVNQHNETGLVVRPADPIALAKAMVTLENDSDISKRFGVAARTRYTSHLTSKQMGLSYLEIYKSVLQEGS